MTELTSGVKSADLRILIVGAGIAGLGAARALRLGGFTPEVIERELLWTHAGAGIYLLGNAARALRALGLESSVSERGTVITHQLLYDHLGHLLVDIDVAALWSEVGPCLALHRADLHQVLASHGEPLPVRMGLPIKGLTQHDDTVTVEFGDALNNSYDLVIGADGIHSTVRHLAFGSDSVRPVGQLAWRFVTECPPEVTAWTVLLGRNVTFLTVPIGNGRVYCYCDTNAKRVPRPEPDNGKLGLTELLAGFAAPVPAILESLGPDTPVHVSPIQEVELNGSWSRGSVLLIGDAAHATSPNMAEGAAMALEDGLVLAECLASERSVARALEVFEARRIPRTQWILSQTHRRDRTRNLPPALAHLVLRRWARRIFHANYRPLLDIP